MYRKQLDNASPAVILFSVMGKHYPHGNKYIAPEDTLNSRHAVIFANRQGTPLNRTFDINVGDNNIREVMDKIIDASGKWFKRKGFVFCYIWTFEFGYVKGNHIHMLIYMPSGYTVAFRRYFYKILGRFGIDTKQKGDERDVITKVISSWHHSYIPNVFNRLAYMHKATAPNALKEALHRKHNSPDGRFLELVQEKQAQYGCDQGIYNFRRIGMSNNINKNARKNAGYKG